MDWGPESYGELNADVYDPWHADKDPTQAVDLLSALADSGPKGPVLELAIGTGRVALPLAERGIEVRGIDASEAMVEQLRAKPGGDKIDVVIGDIADVAGATDESFALVYLVFDGLFFLLTQEEQLRCFAGVADRLVQGGRLVLECTMVDLNTFSRGQRVDAHRVERDQVRLLAVRYSAASQRADAQQVLLSNDGVRLGPIAMRYVWPGELDLMARMAGLDLRHRWGGWQQEPFDDDSRRHVSIYEKP
jgi:SAM-dependent methyltransferase